MKLIPQNGFSRDHDVILEFHPNPQIKAYPPHACCDSVRGEDSGILPWPISKELSPFLESIERPCRQPELLPPPRHEGSSPLWCRWKSDGDPGPLSLSVNNEIETLFAIETLFTTPWIVACPKLLCPWDFQARVLEWVAIFFFFFQGIFPTQVSHIVDRHFTI